MTKNYTYLRDETGAFDIPGADKPIVTPHPRNTESQQGFKLSTCHMCDGSGESPHGGGPCCVCDGKGVLEDF